MKNTIKKTTLTIGVSVLMSGSVFAAYSANIYMGSKNITNLDSVMAYTDAANLGDVKTAMGEGEATGTVRDIEGNEYKTMQTANGNWWMIENMRTSVVRSAAGTTENIQLGIATNQAWVDGVWQKGGANGENKDTATDDAAKQRTNGYYYTWKAAMNGATTEKSQGICMSGWHIPTDQEWTNLENWAGADGSQATVSGSYRANGGAPGTKLKDTTGWNGVLAGYRGPYGDMGARGDLANFWSSNESDNGPFSRGLDSTESGVYRGVYDESLGLSVRCIKD